MDKYTKTVVKWFLTLTVVASLLLPSFSYAQTISDEAKRAQLEQELKRLEIEIAEQEKLLEEQKKTTTMTKKELDALRSDISKRRKQIESKKRKIEDLNIKIKNKDSRLNEIAQKKSKRLQYLGNTLYGQYKKQNKVNTSRFLMANASLSSKSGMNYLYNRLSLSMLGDIKYLKKVEDTEKKQKEKLENEKLQNEKTRAQLEQVKKQQELKKKQKEKEYKENKTKLTIYQKTVEEKKARAAQIKAMLFELRGQKGIPFGEAYEYAKLASKKTGVEPAYILAILKQESNLGKNVGTCNRPGDKLKWRDIMPGPGESSWRDDETAYLQITKELGISPDGQPLSCPIGNGWGGAMGPSQFIPTTWLRYKDRIAQAVGVDVPNPWNPMHAIMATALYVKDLGADVNTFEAQREAACKYYSGRSCYAKGVKNMFYGNSVMKYKKQIQRDIDLIEEANNL